MYVLITALYDGTSGMLDQFATWVAVVVVFDEFAKENGLTSFAEYDDGMSGRFKEFLGKKYDKLNAKVSVGGM